MNNKIKNSLKFLLIFSVMFSCKKEEPKTSENLFSSDTISVKNSQEESFKPIDTTCSAKNTTRDYILSLQWYQEKTEKEAANNLPERNDRLYDDYSKIRNQYIACLNNAESKILEEYVNYYDSESDSYKFPENVKKLKSELEKAGLEFWEIGEGYTEIRSLPNYYYSIFKGKVTADYESYIYQLSKEEKVLYQGDAALNISWKELGNRTIFWENFVKKHPKSPLVSNAKEFYNNYLHDYLFGLDNTSTFNLVGEVNYGLNEENKREFRRFLKENPNSNTAKKVKQLIELFDSKISYEEIQKRINLEERNWEKYP